MAREEDGEFLRISVRLGTVFIAVYSVFFVVGIVLFAECPPIAMWLGGLGILGYDSASWQSILINMSCNLILLSAASALIDRLTHNSIQSFMRASLRQLVQNMNNVAAPLANVGCSGFFTKRQDNLRYILDHSEREFVACGTTLPDATSFTFMSDVVRKIKTNSTYKAEFLILNPASMAAFMKGRISPYQSDSREISDRITAAIISIERARSDLRSDSERDRLKLYLTSTIPTTSCVYSEKTMDLGFYDEVRKGDEVMTWKADFISVSGGQLSMYDYYRKNVEQIKMRADTVAYWPAGNLSACVEVARKQTNEYSEYLSQSENKTRRLDDHP